MKIFSEFLIDDTSDDEIEVVTKKVTKKSGTLPIYLAYNIKAVKVQYMHDAIKITWNVNPHYSDKFYIGRSNKIIDSKAIALSSKMINAIPSQSDNVAIDSGLKSGSYYYVVLSRAKLAKRDVELYRDINYTSFPVIIDIDKIRKISAKKIDKKGILIKWNKINRTGVLYTIFRSKNSIDTEERVKNARKIAAITDKDRYTDISIDGFGTYYYAVISRGADGKDDLQLVPNENYTTDGVLINEKSESHSGEIFKVESITAKKGKKGVAIRWEYSGGKGDKYFRLFRSKKRLKRLRDVKDKDVFTEVDITKNSYIDKAPLSGRFYYGLVPFKNSKNKDLRIISGENIIKYSSEKDERGIKPVRKYTVTNVDYVLKRTFFRGDYSQAVIELHYIIKDSDNDVEIAKARLFSGRSHIEMRQYSKALDYLVLTDVKKYYPEEARFWLDYAISRVNKY